MADLTETAQNVLRSEIASRHLDISKSTQTQSDHTDASDPDWLSPFAMLSSPDCIWQFPESEDAQAAGEMLAEAGIEYDLILPGAGKLDMGAPRLAVRPADVDHAREILSKPIPEGFRVLVRTRDQFVPPNCPECRSDDPLLESIHPTNQWLCEICGHTWIDKVPGSFHP